MFVTHNKWIELFTGSHTSLANPLEGHLYQSPASRHSYCRKEQCVEDWELFKKVRSRLSTTFWVCSSPWFLHLTSSRTSKGKTKNRWKHSNTVWIIKSSQPKKKELSVFSREVKAEQFVLRCPLMLRYYTNQVAGHLVTTGICRTTSSWCKTICLVENCIATYY